MASVTERSALELARAIRQREVSAAADRRVGGGEAKEELPALLRVPFTVKESIALLDMPQSAGLLARRGVRSAKTAPVVQRLINAGGIPLRVTTTSELTLWIESQNRV